MNFQAGWLRRGILGQTLRYGFDYYNGKSSQSQFFNNSEQQIGIGVVVRLLSWHFYVPLVRLTLLAAGNEKRRGSPPVNYRSSGVLDLQTRRELRRLAEAADPL